MRTTLGVSFKGLVLAKAMWKLAHHKPIADHPVEVPMPRVIVGLIENA